MAVAAPRRRSQRTPAATPAAANTAPPSARTPVPWAMPKPAARPTATSRAEGNRVRVRVEVDMSPSLPVLVRRPTWPLRPPASAARSGGHGGGQPVRGEVRQLLPVDEHGRGSGDAVLARLVGGLPNSVPVGQVLDVLLDGRTGCPGLGRVLHQLVVGQPGAALRGLMGVEQGGEGLERIAAAGRENA